jgi:uncharacterized membrane protein YgaE (UPF0421/DUF939 family)
MKNKIHRYLVYALVFLLSWPLIVCLIGLILYMGIESFMDDDISEGIIIILFVGAFFAVVYDAVVPPIKETLRDSLYQGKTYSDYKTLLEKSLQMSKFHPGRINFDYITFFDNDIIDSYRLKGVPAHLRKKEDVTTEYLKRWHQEQEIITIEFFKQYQLEMPKRTLQNFKEHDTYKRYIVY